jgi:hypothetical protein
VDGTRTKRGLSIKKTLEGWTLQVKEEKGNRGTDYKIYMNHSLCIPYFNETAEWSEKFPKS